MNVTSALKPVFEFLDQQIQEHWLFLFYIFVFASLTAIAWILSGGMRPKHREDVQTTIAIIPFVGPRNECDCEPPPILGRDDYA
jgi:hypothetical protein